MFKVVKCLVRFRHNIYLVRFRRRSWFGLKYMNYVCKCIRYVTWFLKKKIVANNRASFIVLRFLHVHVFVS